MRQSFVTFATGASGNCCDAVVQIVRFVSRDKGTAARRHRLGDGDRCRVLA
ncbi:MAG: hypothetical protein IJ845_08055 [Bacteroidaceae bacterium]|nr:hypothetical protein [Bacteroidaceae bacterium]